MSETYLIERHLIVVAPSASLFVRSLERDQALRNGVPRRVLIVADPAFDPRHHPRLRRLIHAAVDSRHLVEDVYPEATLLADVDATSRRFLTELPNHDIVHFAGHALIDASDPRRSGLVTAPEGHADDSLLAAEELLERSSGDVRLVVLAACSTALGYPAASSDVASLAATFLATGVPAVVASLWDVDDESTARFFREFHARLARGIAPAEALRQVQVSMIEDSRGADSAPISWAAFELFGGAAPPLNSDTRGD